MAKYDIIADVGVEIINRLKKSLCPEIIQNENNIIMLTPTEKADFSLSLFLYDIVKLDANLFNLSDNTRSRSLALSLKYMLCSSSFQDIYVKSINEQIIIGKAIETINNNQVIHKSNNFLGETDLQILLQIENISLDDKIKIWNNTGGIRTSVFLEASPILIDSTSLDKSPKVIVM